MYIKVAPSHHCPVQTVAVSPEADWNHRAHRHTPGSRCSAPSLTLSQEHVHLLNGTIMCDQVHWLVAPILYIFIDAMFLQVTRKKSTIFCEQILQEHYRRVYLCGREQRSEPGKSTLLYYSHQLLASAAFSSLHHPLTGLPSSLPVAQMEIPPACIHMAQTAQCWWGAVVII